VKVVVKDVNGFVIPGIDPVDICMLFNGGTAAQGYFGPGADSVIANSAFNPSPLCPDVRCVQADAPTDANGVTYITFTGAGGTRNPVRKWGHYDTAIPVFVMGFQIAGRLTSGSVSGTYVLRIKNFDWTGGLGTALNLGEAVTGADFNGVASGIGVDNAISYWKDFDSSGHVNSVDYNMIVAHLAHDCQHPFSP
jgi:hypothetical protein